MLTSRLPISCTGDPKKNLFGFHSFQFPAFANSDDKKKGNVCSVHGVLSASKKEATNSQSPFGSHGGNKGSTAPLTHDGDVSEEEDLGAAAGAGHVPVRQADGRRRLLGGQDGEDEKDSGGQEGEEVP